MNWQLEPREQDDKAKIDWLRAAAKEGFDAIEHGDYVGVNFEEELDGLLDKISEEATAELAAERKRGPASPGGLSPFRMKR